MGGLELLAVVVFFLIGYWAVDYFWPKKKDAGAAAPSAEQPAAADSTPWHEILGVRPDATLEEIRKAYQEKSAEHNPDRVSDQGPDAREAAVRMTRRINDAFLEASRILTTSRRWKTSRS